jgi:hypothetical protein
MNMARAPAIPQDIQEATARLHSVLRFAVGTTAGFALSEAMGWYPTFLAPLFAGMLLANLPAALPVKAGIALVVVQAGGAYGAFMFPSLLNETPYVLFGIVGLVLFACFANLARGRGMLPILLILIAFATVPIVTMATPDQAGALPLAFTRSMTVAVGMVWLVHSLWPKTAGRQPPAPMVIPASPIVLAVAGTAIVLPLMLVYLMYGITDALPVLITTVVLVTTFDPRRGATQGIAMMIGNFIGGMTAVVALALLRMAPNLAALSLIGFLVGAVFGSRIERGGPPGAVALVTYNQAMVMFSLALVPGGADTGLWMARLLQFAIACAFAVGMLTLLLPPRLPRSEIA